MSKPIIRAPYHDDYDNRKKYTTLLAVPGRAEQAREFTQIQTTIYDYMSRLGNSILRDGAIISGCNLIIDGHTATITEGRIFLNGLVRLSDEQEVDLTLSGSESIGAKVVTTVVTEVDDSSLRDPAQGFENYGQSGSHRLKEDVQFLVNDSEATTVFRLDQGELLVEEVEDDGQRIVSMLARRTYDTSGNYKVNGLQVSSRKEVTEDKVLLSISEGKAYIRGFEVSKPSSVTLPLDFSRDFRGVVNEPKAYSSSTDIYYLNNQPVRSIDSLIANVNITTNLTRGNISGGIDYLPQSPVTDIMSITQGGVTYEKGVDFQLVNDGVDWSPPGKEPNIGSTYRVQFRYNKIMKEGEDYSVTEDEGTRRLGFSITEGVNDIVNGSVMDIDYSFFLARRDLICIDYEGYVSVIKGRSDLLRLVRAPQNQDEDKLAIASVLLSPNSGDVSINNYRNVRMAQEELFNIRTRVNDMEYNQAVSDLDREAMEGEAASDLKGIFTDGFVGFTKADLSSPEFTAAIDLDVGEITLPSNEHITQLRPDLNNRETDVGIMGRILMAPFDHKLVLSQPDATNTMLVNPYAVYNPLSIVRLSPATDTWIESTHMEVPGERTEFETMRLRRWWGTHVNDPWSDDVREIYESLGLTGLDMQRASSRGPLEGVKTETVREVVLEESIQFMRQREVEVSGTNFSKNSNNIEGFFNDVKVPLIPVGSTQVGTLQGTVRADNRGRLNAKFMVPPNVPTGSVDVRLEGPNSRGSAIYRAQGRKQVTQDTVLTTHVTVNAYDPLAQSFQFTKDTVLTSADLFFSAKDDDLSVVIQVRNMVNGYPGTTIFEEQTMNPEDIFVSSQGTEATKVNFTQPVYCKANTQYCITILSDSNEYEMFVATLGEKILAKDEYMTRQPFVEGVLFSSSNALTWTAHQTQDLKFNLYKAEYTGTGNIVFDDITNVQMSRVLLAVQVLDDNNAGVDWTYRVDKSGPWLPMDAFVDRDLSRQSSTFSLRALMNVAHSTSPIMAEDVINLVSFLEDSEAVYVSKNVFLDEPATNVRVSIEMALPSGTTYEVYYKSQDKSDNWIKLDDPKVDPVSTEFSRYSWEVDGLSDHEQFRYKVKLSTSNPLVRPRARRFMSIMRF